MKGRNWTWLKDTDWFSGRLLSAHKFSLPLQCFFYDTAEHAAMCSSSWFLELRSEAKGACPVHRALTGEATINEKQRWVK
jgi:hypothetical protein